MASSSSSTSRSSALLFTFTLSFISLQFLMFQALAGRTTIDPTEGFVELPFDASLYTVQYPYNVQQDTRYSFVDGVHKLWVYSNDKPYSPTSPTKPRTEMDIHGYRYTSGVWQYEGYGYVPQGTTGVSIMQVFGATEAATTLMLHVYNGNLMYYQDNLVAPNIYNRWFRLNVIHDVDADNLKVFIDGQLKLTVKGRGDTIHYFKCGVYEQRSASSYMEAHWKNIRILKKRS